MVEVIESKDKNSRQNAEKECYSENPTNSGQRYAEAQWIAKVKCTQFLLHRNISFLLQRTDFLIDDNIYLCYLKKYRLNATIYRVSYSFAHSHFIQGKINSDAQKSYTTPYKRVSKTKIVTNIES